MNKELKEWAEKYTKQFSELSFNKLSAKHNKVYYTQSPLIDLTDTVDLMIVGINPAADKDGGNGVSNLTAVEFLKGNPAWNNRFSDDGKIVWSKFIGNTHSLLGYRNDIRCDTIDDDAKTVWTNLTPFASHKGSNDLPKELMTAGIAALLELIGILKPRKIVLLGTKAFGLLDRYCKTNPQTNMAIEHLPIIDKIQFEIGRIGTIPTVQIVHPAGQWPISNKFTSIIFCLYNQCEIIQEGVPVYTLQEVQANMQKEIKLWVSMISVVDNRLTKVR